MAIAATIYRLLMELDNEDVAEYNMKGTMLSMGTLRRPGPLQLERLRTEHSWQSSNPSKAR